MTRTVLSFSILDDLNHMSNYPKHVELQDKTFQTIKTAILGLLQNFKNGSDYDPSYFFDREFFSTNEYINQIVEDLLDKNYYRRNRVEKYYVIAFALDYTRFEIFSKDCEKQLIDWGVENHGEIKGIIHNEDYNENPIITLLKNID